jgi:hypothetical protein
MDNFVINCQSPIENNIAPIATFAERKATILHVGLMDKFCRTLFGQSLGDFST